MGRGISVYALSVLGTPAGIKALGSNATGIAITEVAPLPSNVVMPAVREFQQAWKAHGQAAGPSHLALEGYINARTVTGALQRTGKNPTRAGFIDAIWRLKKWDLSSFETNATGAERSASRFVELTLIGHDGRLIR